MKLAEIVCALEEIAPTHLAEEWDNVGLLVGDTGQEVSSAIVTIDYTSEVAREAREQHCGLVVAYHPPIFKPIKRITAPSLIHEAIRNGMAIYSPHTALDVAPGGTNDMLADAIGLAERRPLRLVQTKATQQKLVTFVPEKDAERVSEALFAAGAGWIGNYSRCSFRTAGTGTFFGEEGTSPVVGQSGTLERVPEVRIESIVAMERVAEVVSALKRAHPYETPAFDLLELAAPPMEVGQGRIGTMPSVDRRAVIERIKRDLGLERLLIAGPMEGEISSAACCAGACGDMLDDALRAKAGFYLTGEMRHHDALRAAAAGMTVVCTLHSNSERAVLRRVAERLRARLPGFNVTLSAQDRDPFMIA